MATKRTTRKKKAAERIGLRDSEGRCRIFLGYVGPDDYAFFQMKDARELPRAEIQVSPGGRTLINIQDSGGAGLVNLWSHEECTGLSICQPGGGKPVLQATWGVAEGLRLSIWDSSGRSVWQWCEAMPQKSSGDAQPGGSGDELGPRPSS